MCDLIEDIKQSTDRICFRLERMHLEEMKMLNEVSVFLRDLYLHQHHNDEFLDMENKNVRF